LHRINICVSSERTLNLPEGVPLTLEVGNDLAGDRRDPPWIKDKGDST
jgi:hypothetical protein